MDKILKIIIIILLCLLIYVMYSIQKNLVLMNSNIVGIGMSVTNNLESINNSLDNHQQEYNSYYLDEGKKLLKEIEKESMIKN